MTRACLHREIRTKVQHGVMENLIAFFKQNDCGYKLWKRANDNFIEDQCYKFIFKMLTATGDEKFDADLHPQNEFRISQSTLNNNFKVCHLIILAWVRTKIVLGSAAQQNKAVAYRKFSDALETVNIWMDSSEFPMQFTSENNRQYSHKLRGIEIQVQFVTDAKEMVVYLYGPVELEEFDDHFLSLHKYQLEQKLKGGIVIADSHYAEGERLFADPVFHCNLRESAVDQAIAEKENLPIHSRSNKRKAEIDLFSISDDERQLSLKKLKKNAAISHTRSHIEGESGNIERILCFINER